MSFEVPKRLGIDNALDRQLLLVKLEDLISDHPTFHDSFVSDFKSPQQRWIAKTKAIMKRVGISNGLQFDSAANTYFKFPKAAGNSMLNAVAETIEELRLELELEGDDFIGKQYDPGDVYSYFVDVKSFIGKAKKSVFVIDPYFTGESFNDYLGECAKGIAIRILTADCARETASYAVRHQQQFGGPIEIRRSEGLHDRYIVVDDTDWLITGGSIKDGARKPSYLIPVGPSLVAPKRIAYEKIWDASSVVMAH